MKIEHPDKIHTLNGPIVENPASKATHGADFATVLKAASVKTPIDKSMPPKMHPLGHPTLNALNLEPTLGPQESASRLLDTLDSYQRVLADPNANLRQVQCVLDQMKAQADKTHIFMKALPEGDQLKRVIEETLMQINMESARFERGDYIDQ